MTLSTNCKRIICHVDRSFPLPDFSFLHLSKNMQPSDLTIQSFTVSPKFQNIRTEREEEAESITKTQMALTSAVSVAMPFAASSAQRKPAECFFKPLPLRLSKNYPTVGASRSSGKFEVRASLKEKAITGLTAAALTASMVIPELAEAADSGVSPSLKNFLLSIVAGGVVLGVIVGAVVSVANFDPVKRA